MTLSHINIKIKDLLFNSYNKDHIPVSFIARIVVVVGIAIRFILTISEYSIFTKNLWCIVIILSFLYVSFLVYYTRTYKDAFRNHTWLSILFISDLMLVSLAYVLTGTVDSDFYLFYFLPILTLIENIKPKKQFSYFSFISLLYFIIAFYLISIEANSNLDDVELFIRNVLPRWTFFLIIMLFFSILTIKYEKEILFKNGLISNTFNAIIAIDEKGIVREFNSHAEKVLGISKKNVIGKSVEVIYFSIEHAREVNKKLHENKNGQIVYHKTFLRTIDNKKIPIALSASLIGSGGSVGFFRDLREDLPFKLILDAGKKIFNEVSNLQETLNEITKQAVKLVRGQEEQKCYSTLALLEENLLIFQSTFPKENIHVIQRQIKHINLKDNDSKIGIIGDAIVNDTIINAENTKDYSNFIEIKTLESVSQLVVPIKFEGEILGVLCIAHPENSAFTEQDIRTIKILVSYAGIAIHKAKQSELSKRLKLAIREIIGINNYGKKFNSTLNRIVHSLKDATQSDIVTLHIFNADNNSFIFPFAYSGIDLEDAISAEGKLSNNSIVYRLLNGKKIRYDNNITQDSFFNSSFTLREQIKSSIALPLIVGGKKIGALFVSYRNIHEFNEREIENIELFSFLASTVIIDIQLREQLSERVDKINTLNEIFNSFNANLDYDYFIKSIFPSLKKLVPFHRGSIQKINVDGSREVLKTYNIKNPNIFFDHRLLKNITEDPLIKELIDCKETVYIEDVNKHLFWKAIDSTTDIKTWIGIPLIYEDRPIAIIALDFIKQTSLDNYLIEILSSFGSYAASIYENSILNKKNNEYIKQLEEAESLAMVGLLYGEDIHLSANKLGAARQYAKNIIEYETDMEAMKRYAYKIYLSIEHFLDLIEANIRNLKVPNPKKFTIIETIRKTIYSIPKGSMIQVKFENTNIDSTVYGLERQVTQIFRVIIHNAIKAMKGVGILSIRFEQIINVTPSFILIEVTDTGEGIPEKIIPDLFKIKGPNLNKKSFGIGLGWANFFIERYGGNIDYKTKLDEGTTFFIKIPIDYLETADQSLLTKHK